MRERERERQHTEDRDPDDVLATKPIADRSAEDRPGSDRAEENEEIDLRGAHRDVELLDQIEGVITVEACEVEVLGEDQRRENRQRPADALHRQARTDAWRGMV